MTYQVVTFWGDYQVESQPYWNIEFSKLEDAITAARVQHQKLQSQKKWERKLLHTAILNDDDDSAEFLIYNNKEITDPKEANDLATKLEQE